MKTSPTLRQRLEAGLYDLVEGVIGRLPWDTTLAMGRGIGLLFHALDARHRRVVRDNIRATDLGLDEAGVRALSRECFGHFGALFLSGLRLFTMSQEELERRVKVRGIEHFDQAGAGGKGFIVLTGHYGNWEATSLGLSSRGRTMSVIGRALPNPLLEERLKARRGRYGNAVIPKDGAFRGSIQALRRGEGVGFLLDQDGLGMGVFTKFLGVWSSTFPSAAVLAVKYDLPVVQLRSWPEPDGSITVSVEKPFRVAITGDTDKDVWIATQLMVDKLDAMVRNDPRYWFWMHRRFKTRPGAQGAPELPRPEWISN